MKALGYYKAGLKLEDIEKPVPSDDEVLIKVQAAGVNPLDYHLMNHPLLRRMLASRAKVKVARPGRDVAGLVEAIGSNVTQFKIGDEVFGACNGAFAEYACARERALAIKPHNISFEQAAASPIAALTALQGLRDKARIQPGQQVLINGAAGGVGTFAVQIAKSLGANVTGVCSTRNVEMVQSLGSDAIIDYTRKDYTRTGEHYDVIFDLISNHTFAENKRALTRTGICIGAGMIGLGGSVIRLLRHQIPVLVLSPFVSQKFPSFMAKVDQADLNEIGSLMGTGRVVAVIEKRYSLDETFEALRHVQGGHARGKVIISV